MVVYLAPYPQVFQSPHPKTPKIFRFTTEYRLLLSDSQRNKPSAQPTNHSMTQSHSPTLGQRLLETRKQRGLTQAELAELADTRQAKLSQYESGAAIPRPPTLAKIAEALNTTAEELLDGVAAEPEKPSSGAHPFFMGDDVLHPTVYGSDAETFPQLVDYYLAAPISLKLTREDYNALPKREQSRAKQVPYLTAAVFDANPAPRQTKHAVQCTLIFLDIDDHQQAAPLLDHLDLVGQQLHPWNFAMYTTASSTPSAPRLRIVVDASGGIPLDQYEAAVLTIAKTLGLHNIDRASMVPVQPMFLPSMFADEVMHEERQPLVLKRVTGKPFTVRDIEEVEQSQPRQQTSPENLDALEFLRAPLDEVGLKEATSMLDALDPDLDYRQWLEVAAALKHQFPHHAEEAYALFDQWSSRGSKYGGQDDTRAKWDSFRPNPANRLPVTIRTVMHFAAMAGWDTTGVKNARSESILEWMRNAPNAQTLLKEGIARILAMPLASQSEEEALLNQLARDLRRFNTVVGVSALRKDLKALRQQIRDQEAMAQEAASAQIVPSWARGVCYVAATEEIFRHATSERYTLSSWDNVYGRRLLPTPAQLEGMGLPVNQANLTRPIIPPRQYALTSIKIPVVWDYTYDPSSPNELFVIDAGKAYVNTYRRSHPQPQPQDAETAGALFSAHMDTLIAEPEYRTVLLDWLCYLVQAPGAKIRWSPLIQGAEGCGKTFIADTMAAVLGHPNVKSIGGPQLFSGYNEWAVGHQLVAIEEIRVAGQNRHEVMNVLKPLITNDTIPVNQKFRDTRHAHNRTNYMLLTNHHDALALNHESRRYFVVKSAIQTREQVAQLKERGHFAALYAMLRDMAGGLRHWFESREISPSFDPDASAPPTTHLEDVIDAGAPDHTAAIRRLIREGDHPLIQADLLSTRALMDALNHGTDSLRYKVSAQLLSNILREEGYLHVGRYRLDEGERHYLWRHHNASDRDWPNVAKNRVDNNLVNLDMDMAL